MSHSSRRNPRRRRVAAPARGTRTASGIGVALIAGGGAHVAAGGIWSTFAAMAAALLLIGPAWLLCRDERGWAAIAALLAAGQFVVHGTFMATAVLFPIAHAGERHASMTPVPSAPMLTFHLAAAAAVGWWLRLGERRLWRAARAAVSAMAGVLRRLLHPTPDPAAGHGDPSAPPAPAGAARRQVRLLSHAIVLRGPPAVG